MKCFFNNLIASVAFFTRLPIHRFYIPPKESFSKVLPFATVAGWIVGLFSAAIWWMAFQILPLQIAIIVAVLATVIFTGALHEDGLADFADGFGGGYTKERILAIMKDSQIGTYGVIALILLFAMRIGILSSISISKIPGLLIVGAVVGRYVGVLLPSLLPYARTVEASKIQVGLVPLTWLQLLVATAIALLSSWYFFGVASLVAFAVAVLTLPATSFYIRKKIGGYTGDCCGMLIVVAEVAWSIAILGLQKFHYL